MFPVRQTFSTYPGTAGSALCWFLLTLATRRASGSLQVCVPFPPRTSWSWAACCALPHFLTDRPWSRAQGAYSYITCPCRTHVHAAVLNNRNVFLFFCFFVFVFVWIFCSVVYQDGFYGADLYVSTHTGAFSTPPPDKPAFFFLFLWFGLFFFYKYNLFNFVFFFPCGYIHLYI